jgi:signal transduction histidine kinase
VAEARRRALEWQALQTGLTVALGVLALIAVLLVGRIARQMRNSALAEAHLREEVEALFASRARLIRGFSHDLKNPLGAADSYAQLIEEGVIVDPVRREEGIHRIRASIQSALRLVADLLDLARVDAGQLPVQHAHVDLAALAKNVVAEYSAQAKAEGLELKVEVPAVLPPVDSDEVRIRQVLGNLLSNAIKYTPPGGSIGLRAHPQNGSGDHRCGLDVWDTGPGIPPEMQQRVFDEFTRLNVAKPGAGLGLAISRRLAVALGGDLTLASDGAGAVFTLWLPTAQDARAAS